MSRFHCCDSQTRGPRAVISYRRGDASGEAGRLFDHLAREFGAERVFMDIDTLQPGDDFVESIERAVGSSDAVIAVVGPNWLHGLDETQDFVRFEIATALKLRKRVIPVLVAGAEMPPPNALPEDVAAISRLHAINVSHLRFHSDAQRLVETLRRHARPRVSNLPDQSAPSAPPAMGQSSRFSKRRVRSTLAAVGVVAALTAGVFAHAAALASWIDRK